MPLNVSPKIVSFTGLNNNSQPKSRRDQVEDAAAATGGVGASAAAARGANLKFFKQAEKFNRVTGAAANATRELEKPANQLTSLFRAFKVNYRNLTNQISEWARSSRMPNFMKGLFTGQLGKTLGTGAAIFVFISGLGEVITTAINSAHKIGNQISTITTSPNVD